MPASLHAYAHLEDVWAGGVEAWCREATDLALTNGSRSWLVCATRGQAEWVKARLLRERVPLLGLHFLQAASLRRELCLRWGEAAPGSERESLTLVVRSLAAGTASDRYCAAINQQPTEWLQGLEQLDAAGWLDDDVEFARYIPKPLRNFARRLRLDAGEWLVGVDRRLRARAIAPASAAQSPPRLAVVGWDASCFARTDLLRAAVATAESAAFFSPLPRFANEEIQQCWIDWLSSTFSTTDKPCKNLADWPYDSLVDRLEGAELSNEAVAAPGLLVGKTWTDQIDLIADAVARWLVTTETNPAHRLAVVLPTRNATSVALGRRLAALGITHENTIGERPEPAWEARLLRSLVDYYRENCSAAAFLRLLSVRAEHVDDRLRAEAAADLPRAFQRVQSGRAQHVAVETALAEIVSNLGDWQDDQPIFKRRDQFVRAIRALQLPTSAVEGLESLFEPIWSSVAHWIDANQSIEGIPWLDFLNSALNSIPTARAGGAANARYARVVLTTLPDAAAQTWQAVILADANDEIWPSASRENPLLPDGLRAALNARRRNGQTVLLGDADLAGTEDVRFLALLENCDGPFWFAASGALAESPHRTAHPNEWALRWLIESTPRAIDAWNIAVRAMSRPAPALAPGETRQLAAVRKSRRDPHVPFDEYFLRFGPMSPRPEGVDSFAARTLEKLIAAPAELAYQLVFQASSQREAEDLFAREDRRAIGNIAHRWMHRILVPIAGADAPLDRALLVTALDHGIAAQRKGTELELSLQLHRAIGVPPIAWWNSVLAQAERAARRWVKALLTTSLPDAGFHLATERDFATTLQLANSSSLSIHGRVDLCLFGASETVVLDYKSSDKTKPVRPESVGLDGEHLPLVTYLWLAVGNALPAPRVGLVSAGGPVQDTLVTAEDLPRFENLANQFAMQQRDLLFGQVGPLVAGPDGHCEILPMATIPVSTEILAAKAIASSVGSIAIVTKENGDE